MFIEVIGLEPQDAVAAAQGGADRIELVSHMEEDGLSPTIEIIEGMLAVSPIPFRVMVRFHNDGFVYSEEDINEMCTWMEKINHLPFDGFVLGGITEEGAVDEVFLEQAMKIAQKGNKKVTFHRAFDRLNNQIEAIKVLEKHGVDTVLTSAGLMNPILDNTKLLDELQQASTVKVLAGGGVNQAVVEALADTTVQHAHVGSAVRPNGDFTQTVDSKLVKKLKK